jgi:hypothetical protein
LIAACSVVTRKRNLWILFIARRPLDREETFFRASPMNARFEPAATSSYPAVFNRNGIFHVQPFMTVI